MHLGQHVQISASGGLRPRQLPDVPRRAADESVGEKSSARQISATAAIESIAAKIATATKFAATFDSAAAKKSDDDDEPAAGPRTDRAAGPNAPAAPEDPDGCGDRLGAGSKAGEGADVGQKGCRRRGRRQTAAGGEKIVRRR